MPPVSPPDTTSVQLAFKATSSSTASSNVSATLIDRRNHLLINLNPDMSKFVSAVVHIDRIEQTDPLKLKPYPLRPGQNYIGTTLTVSPTDIRYDFTDLSRYSIKIVVLSKEVGTAPSSLSSYFSYGTESARQNLECYNYLFRNDGGDNFANVSISNQNEIEKGSDIVINCPLTLLHITDQRKPHHVLFTFDEEDTYKNPDGPPPVNSDNSEQLAEYSVYLPYEQESVYTLTNNLLNNDSIYAVSISGIYSDGQVVSITAPEKIRVITSPVIVSITAYDTNPLDAGDSSTSSIMNVYISPSSAPVKILPSNSKITFYLSQKNADNVEIKRYKSDMDIINFAMVDGLYEYTVLHDANFTLVYSPETNNPNFIVYAEIDYENGTISKKSNKISKKFSSDIVSLSAQGIRVENAWIASSVTTVGGKRLVDLADVISNDGYSDAPAFGVVGTLRKTDQYGSGRSSHELFGDLDLVDTKHKFQLRVAANLGQTGHIVSDVKYMYQAQEAMFIRRPGVSFSLNGNQVIQETILTEASMTVVKADSNNIISYSGEYDYDDYDSYTGSEGWNIVNTGVNTNGAAAGKLPKVNLYYFRNPVAAASQTTSNSFELSQASGLGLYAVFNQNQGAKEYPFFVAYTTPTGDVSDRAVNKASWYKSKVFYGPSSDGGDTTTPNSDRAGLTLLYTGTDDRSLFPDIPASRRVKCLINAESNKFDTYENELVNLVSLQTSSNASTSQAGSFNFRLLETGIFTSHASFGRNGLAYNAITSAQNDQDKYVDLIKKRPGIYEINGVETELTNAAMTGGVKADSNTIISNSVENGWSIVNTGVNTNGATGGKLPKVNLYYFRNPVAAASQTTSNSFKLSQASGLGLYAVFNQNQGAKEYPFFIAYTTPTGDVSDHAVNKASWYKSKVFYGHSSDDGDTTTPNSDRAGLTLLYTGTDDGSLFPDIPASRRVKCVINNAESNKFDNYENELVNLVSLQTSSNASTSQAGSFNFRLLETGIVTSHANINKVALRYNQPRARLLYSADSLFPNIPDKESGIGKHNPGSQQRRILYYIPSQNSLYAQKDTVRVRIAIVAHNPIHPTHSYTRPDTTESNEKIIVHKVNKYTMELGTDSEPEYSGTGSSGKLDVPINNPTDAQNDYYMTAATFVSNLTSDPITEPVPANSNGGFNITVSNPDQSFRGVNSGVTYQVFYVITDPNPNGQTINGPSSQLYTIQLKDNPTADNFNITEYSYTTFNNDGKSSFKFKVDFIDGDKTSIDGIRVYFVTEQIPSTLLKDVNRTGHVSNNSIEFTLQQTGPSSSVLTDGVQINGNESTLSENKWLNFRSGSINFVPYFTKKANTSTDPNRTDVAEAFKNKNINNIPVIDPVLSSSVSLTGGVIQSVGATCMTWSDETSKYASVSGTVTATHDVNGQVNNSTLENIALANNVSTYTNVIKVKITAVNDSSVYYSQPTTLKFDSVSVDQTAMTISVKRGTNANFLRTTRGDYSAYKSSDLNVVSVQLVNLDVPLVYQGSGTIQPVGTISNPNVYNTSMYMLGTGLKLVYRVEAGVNFSVNTVNVGPSTPLYLTQNSPPLEYVVADKPSLSVSPSYNVVDGKMFLNASIDAKGLHNEGLQGVVFVLAQEGDFTNANDPDANGASVTLVFNSSQAVNAVNTYQKQEDASAVSTTDNMAQMETFEFTDRTGGVWKLVVGTLGPNDQSVIEFPATTYGGFHNTKPLLAVGIATTRMGTVATDGFLDITPPLILL
jgi:hypothetical protein